MKHIDYPYLCPTCKNNIEGYNEKCESCGQNNNYESNESNGDLISRQAVINTFKKWQPYMATMLYDFENELHELPSVSQAKIGHWIENGKSYICSECGSFALRVITGCLVNRHDEPYLSNFCPNCGAKMVEPQESEYGMISDKLTTDDGEPDGTGGHIFCP